jgi:hypothetical protein
MPDMGCEPVYWGGVSSRQTRVEVDLEAYVGAIQAQIPI